MKNKKMWIIIGVVAVVVIWLIAGYNGLVSKEESLAEAKSNVENAYQRRADLIGNLVETVKGYAAHEQETLTAVTDARVKSFDIDPATVSAEQLKTYINAVGEAYPDLKANQNFLDLQSQLEGTENRITTERRRYNEAVKEYNTSIRKFPTTIIASLFGFDKAENWEAQEGAEVVPTVSFQ